MFNAVVNLRRAVGVSVTARRCACGPFTSSAFRSTSAATAAASTWGRRRFALPGSAERLTALGVTVVDEGDLVAPIPEVKSLGDPQKKYIREIARVCEKLYKTSLAALEKGGIPLVLGGDHSLAAGSVAATADFVRRERRSRSA